MIFGAGQYSIRVWLDPEKLKARGLTAADVTQALQQQSQQVAAGQLGGPPTEAGQPFQYTVTVAGRLAEPEQFANVIVKTGEGARSRACRCRPRRARRADLRADLQGQ